MWTIFDGVFEGDALYGRFTGHEFRRAGDGAREGLGTRRVERTSSR